MQPTKAQVEARKKKEAARKAAEANRQRAGAGSSARQAEQNKYKKPAAKPAAKPADAKPALSSEGIRGYGGRGPYARTAPTGSSAYNAARNKQIEAERERLKGVGNPPAKPSPPPSPEASKPPAPKPKPTATKPADKVPSSGSTKPSNQDKSYRGNLFEKTFGYKKGQAPDQRNKAAEEAISANKASRAEYNVGQKEGERRLQNGKEVQLATAQRDKARPKQGPANPAEPAKPASPASPNEPRKYAQASKGMTLAERMRRRRMGLD